MNIKRVAITGHSAGIGQALYQHFSNQGIDVRGYDLSNGYDLNTDVNTILADSCDCDLFINNVWYQQVDLAQKWFKLHKKHNYTLINIGSAVTDPAIVNQLLKRYPELEIYVNSKKLLNEISTLINVESSSARSILIKSGFVDTNFVPSWEEQIVEYFPNSTFIQDFNSLKEKMALQSTDQIVRAVEYALADTSGNVTEITLDNPTHILSL